jgi:hypothetical protein
MTTADRALMKKLISIFFAGCAMNNDPELTAKDAFDQAETMVAEADRRNLLELTPTEDAT